MNLSPLHAITNVGVLLGGQASAWQKNLAAFGTDSYIRTQLENLIDAAQLKIAPVVREVSQIVPGGLTRLQNPQMTSSRKKLMLNRRYRFRGFCWGKSLPLPNSVNWVSPQKNTPRTATPRVFWG